MATKKRKRFAEGGIAADKEAGLKASQGEKVGFFERLMMGNIDQEGSEAYNRFGAGRAKADRDRALAESKPSTNAYRVDSGPGSMGMSSLLQAGAKAGERQPSGDASVAEMYQGSRAVAAPQQMGDASVAEMYQGPRTKSIVPSQSAPKASSTVTNDVAQNRSNRRLLDSKTSKSEISAKNDTAQNRSNRRLLDSQTSRSDIPTKKTGADAIPGQNVKPVVGEKIEPMSDAERNINNLMIGSGAGAGIFGLYKKGKSILNARKAAQAGAKKRAALKRDVEEGIDRNLADEFKNYSSAAAEKAIAAKQRAADRTRDLASGQAKTKFTSESAKPSKATKKFNDEESNVEFKRGGKIKKSSMPMKKMASGGMTSTASKRGDGIAQRGKTRGRIY